MPEAAKDPVQEIEKIMFALEEHRAFLDTAKSLVEAISEVAEKLHAAKRAGKWAEAAKLYGNFAKAMQAGAVTAEFGKATYQSMAVDGTEPPDMKETIDKVMKLFISLER